LLSVLETLGVVMALNVSSFNLVYVCLCRSGSCLTYMCRKQFWIASLSASIWCSWLGDRRYPPCNIYQLSPTNPRDALHLPHMHFAPRLGFAETFGVRKLWVPGLGYRVALFAWSYVQPFQQNTDLWQTDRLSHDYIPR